MGSFQVSLNFHLLTNWKHNYNPKTFPHDAQLSSPRNPRSPFIMSSLVFFLTFPGFPAGLTFINRITLIVVFILVCPLKFRCFILLLSNHQSLF